MFRFDTTGFKQSKQLLDILPNIPPVATANTPSPNLSKIPQTVDASGKCPTGAQARDNGLILVRGAKGYLTSAGSAELDIPLLFRQEMELLDQNDDRVLLSTINVPNQQCVWVETAHVLIGRAALRVKDLNPRDVRRTKTGVEIKNPLLVKALVRSNPNLPIASSMTKWDGRKAPIYDHPDASRPPVAEVGIFGLFSVYKIVKDSIGGDWLYISNEDPYAQKAVSGWIQRDNVYLWESQISLYFSDTNERPLDIFSDAQSAVRNDKQFTIASRRPDHRYPPARNTPRFPILGQQELGNGTMLYEIAMIAESCEASDRCRSVESIDVASNDFGRLHQRAKNLDILFVIDNTESMQKYFGPVIDGIRAVAGASGGHRIRFAAAVYGDYRTPAAQISNLDFELINFGRPNDHSHLNKLYRIKPFVDHLRDHPEAGFAGLVRATRSAAWAEDAATRVVFWIGDHGNRDVGQNETLSAKDVRDALVAKKVSVFFAINVAGRFDQGWDSHDRFVQQAAEIVELSKLPRDRAIGGLPAARTYTKVNPGQENTTHFVSNHIKAALDAVAEARELVANAGTLPIRGGGARQIPGYNTPESDLASEGRLSSAILRANGLSTAAIGRVLGAKQYMTTGYVRADKSSNNLTFWITLDEYKLVHLRSLIDSMCSLQISSDISHHFPAMLVNLAAAVSGDSFVDRRESINDFLARVLFLPTRHFPTILNNTPDELNNLWKEDMRSPARSAFRNEVCKSAFLLNQVANGRRISLADLEPKDPLMTIWGPKLGVVPATFDWRSSLNDGIVYYTIPVNYLPGNVEFSN